MNVSRLSRWLTLPSLALFLLGVNWQRQNIIDWWRLRDYDPPQRIVELADKTTMNPSARRLFYVHHPSLEDKQDFNAHCGAGEESIVLGCYISHTGIYIYDVKEPRLGGIHEATSAHELLHAAYDRLNKTDKTRIDGLLNKFLESLVNQRIKETIESYRQKDAATVPSELHSIIGTEVRDIPKELEDYYSRYFDNRLKVVEFSEAYEQAFTDIKNRVAEFDAELASLKTKIDANETELRNLGQEINADRANLDAKLAAGDTSGYNAAVPGFNAKVRRYNNLVAATRTLINRYNRLIEERNALASEEQELHDALDSRLPPQPQE